MMNIEYGDLILISTIHHIRFEYHLNIDWNMKNDWKLMKTTIHNSTTNYPFAASFGESNFVKLLFASNE